MVRLQTIHCSCRVAKSSLAGNMLAWIRLSHSQPLRVKPTPVHVGRPTLRRGATFTFRPADALPSVQASDSSPRRSSLRRTISVPVTSTSRDTAPLAYHAKVTGASRAAVAGKGRDGTLGSFCAARAELVWLCARSPCTLCCVGAPMPKCA